MRCSTYLSLCYRRSGEDIQSPPPLRPASARWRGLQPSGARGHTVWTGTAAAGGAPRNALGCGRRGRATWSSA
jgi:hypothetical protein